MATKNGALTSSELSHAAQMRQQLEQQLADLQNQLAYQQNDNEAQNKMFQMVLDHIPMRIFWKDLERRYLGANRLFLQDAQCPTHVELIGRNDYDLPWTKGEADAFRADDLAVIQTNQSKINIEEPQTRADGKAVWLRTNKIPMQNDNGDIVGVLGTYEDITEQKQQQLILANSEERYKLALMGLDDGIFDWNLDAEELFLSDTAKEILGLEKSHTPVTPQDVLNKIGPQETTAFQTAMSNHLKGISDHFCFEVKLVLTNKNIRWVQFRGLATPNNKGTCQRMSGSISNITSRKLVEQQIQTLNNKLDASVSDKSSRSQQSSQQLSDVLNILELAKDELIQSEKMASLGRLVSGVTHEVNTPLGVGITAASHLEDEIEKLYQKFTSSSLTKNDFMQFFDSAKEGVQMLMTNLDRASELIRGFKQVAVDQSSEAMREIAVDEYIREILLSLAPKTRKNKVAIKLEIPKSIYWLTYPGSIAQIFTNLIMNSVIHAFSATHNPVISISCQQSENHLLFIYADNGCGMTDDVIERLFDPFFTTKRGEGGSGLGMNIVFNLVTERLKGSIQCQSKLNEGTKFLINLPWKTNMVGDKNQLPEGKNHEQ